jgi:hypothetical protein
MPYGFVVVSVDWSDLPGRLARVATHPAAGSVFGAWGHKWSVEPRLRPDELLALESRLRVRLPDEYRDFLLEVSRGGAGPGYGLFPLRRTDGQWQWVGDGANLTDLDTLAQPFGHVDAFNPADGLSEPPDEDGFDSKEQFNLAEDAYWEQHDAVVNVPEHTIGLLYLCHLGCSLREVLVVTGPARGQMWADDSADDGGYRPLLDDDGSRIGFARWYRRWLDAAEARIS